MKKISKERFARLYETKNNSEVCKIFDISEKTLYRLVTLLEIKKKGGKGRAGRPSIKIK